MKSFVSNKVKLSVHGCYTVIPIIKGKLLDLPYHYKRIKEPFDITNKSESYQLTCRFIDMIQNFNLKDDQNGHAVITLCSQLDKSYSFDMNYFSMNFDSFYSYASISLVETYPFQRQQPYWKNIKWPLERQHIENQRKLSSEEIILISKLDGGLLEGLTTNIFVVNTSNKSVYVPPDDLILPGSMARLVVASCKIKNISIFREPLTLNILKSCDSLFLTSATKPIIEVENLHIDSFTTIPFQKSALVEDLQKFLLDGLFRLDDDFLSPFIPYPLFWSKDNDYSKLLQYVTLI
jgi:branched-subunit amino acid aminotransferase/4-amino-4-deoxychorismate lyase